MDNVGFKEGSLLRESDGAWLGLRDTDGCMLGLEFGAITLNDRSNASRSNPVSVHDVVSNDSFLPKESIRSSLVPIFSPL
eukprot:scaffold629403_cov130-Attheya_sp.AAC.1